MTEDSKSREIEREVRGRDFGPFMAFLHFDVEPDDRTATITLRNAEAEETLCAKIETRHTDHLIGALLWLADSLEGLRG
jgi:hypothetical protein